jgi:uncharacterized protein (TIGR00290 family)
MKKTLLSWSSGKDSAWSLHMLRQDPEIDLVGIYSVVNATHQRVAMHATRLELLQRQAEAVGLPLDVINIPHPCTNEQCEAIMGQFVRQAVARGIECMAFGDLFLPEIRAYREHQLEGTDIAPLFPLWGIPTRELALRMLSAGLEAHISCVDPRKLPAHFAGRKWSRALLDELPATVDPCGENGEFHTIAVSGPMFRKPLDVRPGEIVEREGFVFADVLLV